MDRIMTWGTKKGQPSRPLTYEIPITSRRSACLELVSIFGILTPRHVLLYNSSNNSNLEMVLLVHLSRDFLLNISIHLFIKMICKKFMDHSRNPNCTTVSVETFGLERSLTWRASCFWSPCIVGSFCATHGDGRSQSLQEVGTFEVVQVDDVLLMLL